VQRGHGSPGQRRQRRRGILRSRLAAPRVLTPVRSPPAVVVAGPPQQPVLAPGGQGRPADALTPGLGSAEASSARRSASTVTTARAGSHTHPATTPTSTSGDTSLGTGVQTGTQLPGVCSRVRPVHASRVTSTPSGPDTTCTARRPDRTSHDDRPAVPVASRTITSGRAAATPTPHRPPRPASTSHALHSCDPSSFPLHRPASPACEDTMHGRNTVLRSAGPPQMTSTWATSQSHAISRP
jgi:hypothetical protein